MKKAPLYSVVNGKKGIHGVNSEFIPEDAAVTLSGGVDFLPAPADCNCLLNLGIDCSETAGSLPLAAILILAVSHTSLTIPLCSRGVHILSSGSQSTIHDHTLFLHDDDDGFFYIF